MASAPFGASPAYSRYVLGLLFGVAVFALVDRQIYGMLIEPIKREFAVSDTWLGLASGLTFALFYALAGLPIARWADRGVRRSIIALGLFAWSAMTLASGLVTSFAQLVAARLAIGIGEAAGTPTAHALISDYFPPARRAGALSIYTAGASLGVFLAYLAGGWIQERYGWRGVFLCLGAPGMALALLVRLTVREPPRGRGDRHDARVRQRRLHGTRHPGCRAHHGPAGGTRRALDPVGSGRGEPGHRASDAGVPLRAEARAGARLSRAGRFPRGLRHARHARGDPGLARPATRATAAALNLLVLTLIGAGLGPTLIGVLNDALQGLLGAEAVRWSLALAATTWAWSGAHALLGARTLRADLHAAASAD